MANEEQGPAASDPCRHPLHPSPRPARHVDIQQTTRSYSSAGRPGRKIGLDPVDALGERPAPCSAVDRAYASAVRRSRPRVTCHPRAASQSVSTRGRSPLEGPSGTQVADSAGQMGVRGPLRDAIPRARAGLATSALPDFLGRTRSCLLTGLHVIDARSHRWARHAHSNRANARAGRFVSSSCLAPGSWMYCRHEPSLPRKETS